MANPAAEQAAEAVVDHSEHMTATVEDHAGETHHAEPQAFGIGPGSWVAISMIVLLLIAFLKAKVHKSIGGGLDSKIATIKQQLDEAKALRAEAETLRNEYSAKIANAEKDAAAMLDHAKSEAEAIVAKAAADTESMIARRKQMAEDKIAAAERGAVEELRAKAADAATLAARSLIADKHDAEADKALVDGAISAI